MEIQEIKLTTQHTVSDYIQFKAQRNTQEIANLVKLRLTERYILPILHVPTTYKNGFNMLANACLLIETYESFNNGWNDTNEHNRKPFQSFFKREQSFKLFDSLSKDFYINVRCGILHQGETKNGWKINRKRDTPLLDYSDKNINANLFIKELNTVIENYAVKLKNSTWECRIVQTSIAKLDYIMNNNKMNPLYFAYGSNMCEQQMQKRNVPYEIVGSAILENYQLIFNKINSKVASAGYANVKFNRGSHVEGVLYKIQDFKQLDYFEGSPIHYYKEELTVLLNGQETKAIVYKATNEKTSYGLKPTRDYLNKLLNGKNYLSKDYYNQLKSIQTVN